MSTGEAGESLGLSDLAGAGRSEVARVWMLRSSERAEMHVTYLRFRYVGWGLPIRQRLASRSFTGLGVSGQCLGLY